ncbi:MULTISPECIES: hypothetical protein [Kitasatospora]|uniref:Uncharacterized protein n=1 Tax=Kitasatospora setae (strain ATCC 33774 / DSM 43861 / JCM 3304 / KCC A-0304 / NBRC 14216 / KM-6054) TaxID=452652 RepID=E4NIC0_KITSK|nr:MULTISPECIES: hypothetical protein [Kitasatospora]BAJ31250.1 hypothetical protein KSE_54750 [Kitasatospora setae KM-6054]
MAIVKSTIQQQVADAIAAIEPNDRPVATIQTITGPSPWLTNGVLGLIGQLLVKYYFVTLTHRVVVIHRTSRISNRPQEVLYVIPLEQARVSISDVRRNPLWSSLRFQLPGEATPTRMNIHRIWRTEMDTFVNGLTGGAPGVPGQYPAPQLPGQAPYPQQQAPVPPQQGYPAPPQQPYPPQQQAYPAAPPQQAPGQYPPAPGANPYQS